MSEGKIIVICVLAALLFVAGLIVWGETSNRNACEATANAIALEWKYAGGDCKVNTPEYGWHNAYDYIEMRGKEAIRSDKR